MSNLLIALLILLAAVPCLGQQHPRALNNSTVYLPRWSPDGSQLVFSLKLDEQWQIHVTSADGSKLLRLSTKSGNDKEPSWSHEGSKIIFDSDRDGDREIYSMNADGSQPTRLTKSAGTDRSPVFSPDGSRIVFVSARDGKEEIYVMNADGSRPTRLTSGSLNNEAARPVWSPDGTRLVFYSTREAVDMKDKKRRLYVMDADGSRLRAITPPGYEGNPSWSPTGNRIALDAHALGLNTSADWRWEIFVISADGKGRRRLTNNRANDWAPAWSPDGTKIAYCSGWNNQYEIYVMNSDGSRPTRITRLVYP